MEKKVYIIFTKGTVFKVCETREYAETVVKHISDYVAGTDLKILDFNVDQG